MDKTYNFISCDCGNSSTRVILCRFDGRVIKTRVILQEPNDQVRRGAYFYWDIKRIFAHLKRGVALAAAGADRIHSVGVCTWGIDFAFFDEEGAMISDPLSYRNTIGKEELDKLPEAVLEEMFYRTGILPDKINSVFMLKGIQSKLPDLLRRGGKLLMIPDILNYFFTGSRYNEVSEASTTQLLDVRTMRFSRGQCEALGIDPGLFYPVAEHGICLGNILPSVRDEIGLGYEVPVVCVPSHDTASAVLGAPVREETFAFISAGTWALIGLHNKEPIITERVMRRGFTNEVGAFGHITLLKNSIGFFIIQRLRADYTAEQGRETTWEDLDRLAEEYAGPELLFDVNHPLFFNPPSMKQAILTYLSGAGQLGGDAGWPLILSAAVHSLAASFSEGIKGVMEISGINLKKIVIVGGGARNKKLNQLVADISGLEVAACGMECTSIGNALAQAAFACKDLDYMDLRRIAAASLDTETYVPLRDRGGWLEKYGKISRENTGIGENHV
jgi:sugar (pentulose or hexulose) kinase